MTNNADINFKEVVARFQNSAEVLNEIQGRLSSLSSTDALHRETVEASRTAATSLQEITSQLRAAVDVLSSTLLVADSTLMAAKEFLSVTDLSEVGRQLRNLTSKQEKDASFTRDQLESVEAILKQQVISLQTQITETTRQVGSLSAENDALQNSVLDLEGQQRALAKQVSQIPERIRNKYGL